MYFDVYGLRQNPFMMSPDPRLLYMTAQHREALAGLFYAVLQGKGLAVLTGDAGTGKTTILRRALASLPVHRIPCSIMFNPTLTAAELLEMAMLGFGIKDIPATKPQRLRRMQEFLLEAHDAGRVPLLAIDEAHVLSRELLEEVRLLSNFELANAKLLQIVLIGQNELAAVLDQENLRQLKQRIAVRLSINPLHPSDTDRYIKFRWTECGGTTSAFPFIEDALVAIATISQGIPRVINSLCDNSLMVAFGQGLTKVTLDHVHEAAGDLQLKIPSTSTSREGEAGEPPRSPAVSIAPVRILDEHLGERRRSVLWRWLKVAG